METTNPEQEVEQPSPELSVEDRFERMFADENEAPEPEPVEEQEPEAVEEDQAEEPAPVEDAEEVALGESTFKVPKPVAEVVKKVESLQADYTRKTQEVAEVRKRVEDKEQYLSAREQLLQSGFQEAAELKSIEAQIAQIDAVDLASLMEQDSSHAVRLMVARQKLQTQLAEKQTKLSQIAEQSRAAQEMHRQKQMELGAAELLRRVGKLSDSDRQATWQQGVALGFSEGELSQATDPRLMHALYKAAKWDALQASKPQVEKKVSTAKPMQAPAARAASTSVEQAKRDAARTALKKTGKTEAAEAYLARLFEQKRKR